MLGTSAEKRRHMRANRWFRPTAQQAGQSWRAAAVVLAVLSMLAISCGGEVVLTSPDSEVADQATAVPTAEPAAEPTEPATSEPETDEPADEPTAVPADPTAVPEPTATSEPTPSPEPTRAPVTADGSIGFGDPVQGTISDIDEPLTFVFEATAGDIIDLTVASIDDGLDVIVDVLDNDQSSIVGGEVDEGISEEYLDGIPVSSTGAHTIVVSPYATVGGTVEVALDLVASAPAGPVVAIGETRTVDVTAELAGHGTFLAERGDWIDVTLQPEADFDAILDLQDSSGSSLLVDGFVDRAVDREVIRVLEIPETGYYTVMAGGFDGATGSAEVTIEASNNGLPGTVLRGVDEITEAGEAHLFPFNGLSGDKVTLLVDPEVGDHDFVLSVFDDDTDVLLDQVDNSTGQEELTFDVVTDGQYYFEVTGFEDSTGEYAFILVGTQTTVFELATRDEVSGRLGDESQQYIYYAPAAGTLTVTVVGTDRTDVVLAVGDPSDESVVEADFGVRDDAETVTIDVEADGVYFIDVSSFWGGGSFTMLLESS